MTIVLLETAACNSVEFVKGRAVLSEARNLDFEGGTHAGNLPNGWGIATGSGSGTPDDYVYDVDTERPRSGRASLRIRFAREDVRQHGGVYQCLQRPAVKHREVSLSGFVKTAGAEDAGASLWINAFDGTGRQIAFESMAGRRSRGTRPWEPHEVSIVLPPSMTVARLCFGFFHEGRGTVWIDDMAIRQSAGGSS